MNTPLLVRLAALACTLLSLGGGLRAANTPQWTLTVPALTTVTNSNTSDLIYASSDALGYTLLLLHYSNQQSGATSTYSSTTGFQYLLLKPNGHLLAQGDVVANSLHPLQQSSKRLLCLVDNVLKEFKVATGGTFTVMAVPFTSANEIPFDSSTTQALTPWGVSVGNYTQPPPGAVWTPALNRLIDKGKLYTTERGSLFGPVTTIRRYVIGTLKP